MEQTIIQTGGFSVPLIRVKALVVGSGAAGYAAADALYEKGVRDVLILTEGRTMGTSRNTGSDKQTFYKLNLAGDAPDSVCDMARSLMRGGSMHGDIALSDAALSAKAFFKLVSLGVPFPCNDYGEYVGYRTDHDSTTRATSAGPLTSKYMTEALERAVAAKSIPVLDRHRVIRILQREGEALGVLALCEGYRGAENPAGLCAVLAENTVYAVGGPSAIYADTVYPESQTSALGAAFEAGAIGANLTESQYGIASVGFRWNLSGTYQQVLPRYVSVDSSGAEREFLSEVFDSDGEMLSAMFRKGYEWPFDPAKAGKGGSSRIDLAVFREKERGRRVYLDFRRNPSCLMKDGRFDPSALPADARDYIERSDAMGELPVLRLEKMNAAALLLYREHGVELTEKMLEISVSAQHNNGGIAVSRSREAVGLRHFYAVGECAGTFGVTRPGGSALLSTQTGALLAAEAIAESESVPRKAEDANAQLAEAAAWLMHLSGDMTRDAILKKRREYGERMSFCGAFLRDPRRIEGEIGFFARELADFDSKYKVESASLLTEAMINRDILLTARVFLGAILDYIRDGGQSRGSYLVTDGGVEGALSAPPTVDTAHGAFVQYTAFDGERVTSEFERVRPLPDADRWFERVFRRSEEKRQLHKERKQQ